MLGGGGIYTTIQGVVENIDETPQIKYYNYAPNTIKVVGGSDTINFNYTPSTNIASTTSVEEYTFPTGSDIDPKHVKNIDARAGQTIAYEYVFGNAMNRTAAVNLKSIGDTTGVTVSYLWRTSPLPQGEAVTNSPAKFTCQEMANNGDTIYLYVIVSSESSTIPADFTTDIVWYYGVPYDLTFTNNVTGTTDTVKLVKNQEIDENVLEIPEGYYFDAWFKDIKYTKMVDINTTVKAGANLYPRYHNIPMGVNTYISYNAATDSYKTTNGCFELIDGGSINLIIPTYYDDGTGNGRKLVTHIDNYSFTEFDSDMWVCFGSDLQSISLPVSLEYIGDSAFEKCTRLSSIIIPDNVTTIRTYAFGDCDNLVNVILPSKLTAVTTAFYGCDNLISVDMSNCKALEELGSAFQECIKLIYVIFPNNLVEIDANTFSGCKQLETITIPSNVKFIGWDVFRYCVNLTSIIFEDPNNWYKSTSSYSSTYNDADIIDLSNSTMNATYFKSTYRSHNWYKK